MVIGGSGDLEHAAQRSDCVIDLLHLDEPIVAHRISLAKKVAASFLRMLRSSLEHSDLASKALLALSCRQAIPLAAVDVGPLHPIADCRLGETQVDYSFDYSPDGVRRPRLDNGRQISLELNPRRSLKDAYGWSEGL